MGWPWDMLGEYTDQLDLLRESIVERVAELELARLNQPPGSSHHDQYWAYRAAEEARYQLHAFDLVYHMAKQAERDDPDEDRWLHFLRDDWPPLG